MPIVYELEPRLDTDEFIDILVRSSLAHRRPVDQPAVIQAALAHSDIVVTARLSGNCSGRGGAGRPRNTRCEGREGEQFVVAGWCVQIAAILVRSG